MRVFKWLSLIVCLLLGFPCGLAQAQEQKAAEAAEAADPPPDVTRSPSYVEPQAPPAPLPPDIRATPKNFNGADNAWMMVSSALVLLMTAPGLALFYCGLVRKKNVLSVMMQCVFLMGILSVIWAVYGYSLAFGRDALGGFIGNGDFVLLKGVMPSWDPSDPNGGLSSVVVPMIGSLPRTTHMVYQMMFFIITPALICGAYAERMKFSAMVVFTILWGTLVYCPIAHWVWSDTGWLNFANKDAKFASFDFAGGTVVQVSSGFSALICALLLGKRLGYGQEAMPPHNLTYTCIGAALLWVGWFGFNAGSALASTAQAANAFVATHLAAAMGAVVWPVAEWAKRGKPSILGACSGAVAGLVCVTPACGFVNPVSGMILGLAAGFVCYTACNLKSKFGYDDSLDAFGVHGVGGTLGALLTGVFATGAVIPGATGPQGLLEGKADQLVNQAVGVAAAAGLAVIGSLILLKVIDIVMGLRVTQQEELQGLDVTQHGEEGYINL